jgi:hypothetical protein
MNDDVYYETVYEAAMATENAMYELGKTVTIMFERLEDKQHYDVDIKRWGSQTILTTPGANSITHTDVTIIVGNPDPRFNDWKAISKIHIQIS